MKPWWEEERWLRGDFWVQNSVLQGHTEKWEGGCVCPSRACGTVSPLRAFRKVWGARLSALFEPGRVLTRDPSMEDFPLAGLHR